MFGIIYHAVTFSKLGVAGRPSPLKTHGPVLVKIEGESSQAYRITLTGPLIPLSVTVFFVATVAFTRTQSPALPVESVATLDTSNPYPPRSLIPKPSVPIVPYSTVRLEPETEAETMRGPL